MSGGGRLRIVLGDQCSRHLSALRDCDCQHDTVLMMEVAEECTYVPHHPQKIALVLSAMRHFAAALQAAGMRVDYVRLDDPANTQCLRSEVRRAIARHRPRGLILTHPGEWRVLREIQQWQREFGLPVEIREDDRFICSPERFRAWAAGRRQLRLEHFYRAMRHATGLLMAGENPVGGRWNFDSENRRRLPRERAVPPPPRFPPDAITREVLALVARRFGHHFGHLADFAWPVTAAEAEVALAAFLRDRLPHFGAYQDAMAAGQPFLFHSLLSTSLNLGLLDPLAVCRAAEAEWQAGRAPLNAVEGFIRQILGWREYMRGIYWLQGPGYGQSNALGATRPLPAFYWGASTPLRCLAEVVAQTRDYAYAHHIQRLMITGNFALLAGIAPAHINAWYLAVYADAFEWVQLPNTHGMAIYADGGVVASKPYAASAAYINRMSDYCARCTFDPRRLIGPRACPFNFLYWDFLARHADYFIANPRLALPLATLARMDAQQRHAIRHEAETFLARLEA